jgi:hypothetical protein
LLHIPDAAYFNSQVDNYTGNYSDLNFGVNVPGHASAHTKGANTNLLNGLAVDCFGLSIVISTNNISGFVRSSLTDILIDPAAGIGNPGSSWSVLIANLFAVSPGFEITFGTHYYFPIYIAAGTAIGAAHQNGATSQSLHLSVRAHGKPTRPELLKYGTKVQTLGANTGSTTGTSFTSGTNAMGSYSSSLGTLNFDAWWWQLGAAGNTAPLGDKSYLADVAVNATNKLLCMQDVPFQTHSLEISGKGAMGSMPPIRHVQSGEDVYVRGACVSGAPDSTVAVVYALGG